MELAADLANRRPRTIDELVTRCIEAGVVVDFPVSEDDLGDVLAVLDRWAVIVDAANEQNRAEQVNLLLAKASAYPRLTNHAGDGWHLHYRDDQRSSPECSRHSLPSEPHCISSAEG